MTLVTDGVAGAVTSCQRPSAAKDCTQSVSDGVRRGTGGLSSKLSVPTLKDTDCTGNVMSKQVVDDFRVTPAKR